MSETITLKGQPVTVTGTFLTPGAKAPDFLLVGTDLSDVTLKTYAGKHKVLNIFPSVDTGTCATSVRKFNQLAGQLDNTLVLCISADLPFAQKRFCGAEGLEKVIPLSTLRDAQFRQHYGVAIDAGPMKGLAARAVVVLDEHDTVIYSQRVSEIASGRIMMPRSPRCSPERAT